MAPAYIFTTGAGPTVSVGIEVGMVGNVVANTELVGMVGNVGRIVVTAFPWVSVGCSPVAVQPHNNVSNISSQAILFIISIPIP